MTETNKIIPVSMPRKTWGERLITGLIILAPAYLTFIIIRFIVNILAGPLRPLLDPFFYWLPGPLMNFVSTLIAVAITLLLIIGIGAIGQRVIGRRMVLWFESIVDAFPVVGAIYQTIKQILKIFSEKDKYQSVVFIKMFGNYRSIGFLTNESIRSDGKKEYAIFVPTIPNPTTGYLLFAAEEDVEFSELPVETAFRVIFSGGVLGFRGQGDFHTRMNPNFGSKDQAGDIVNPI